MAIENYLMEKKVQASEHSHETSSAAPSAPADEEVATSSNAEKSEDSQGINTTECVICLDMAVSFSLHYSHLLLYFTNRIKFFSVKLFSFPADTCAVAPNVQAKYRQSVRCVEVL